MKRAIGLAATMAAYLTLPAHAQSTGDAEIDAYLRANRTSNAILREGTYQSTLALGVGMRGSDFGIGSHSATMITSSVGLAYGLNRRTELFVDIPFSWMRSTHSFLDESISARGKSGNVTLGLRRVLAFETDRFPEIVGMAAFSHPVGKGGGEPGIRLGIDAYRMLDPVLLNFGLGIGGGLETREIQVELRGGVDFAISDRFGLGLDVSWVTNGGRFGDPLEDGLSLTVSGSITSESGASTITPYFTIGATSGANNAVVGVSLARRW